MKMQEDSRIFLNDQASGLARPHVTGETINSFDPPSIAGACEEKVELPFDSNVLRNLPLKQNQERKPTVPSKYLADVFENDHSSRFHHKAER